MMRMILMIACLALAGCQSQPAPNPAPAAGGAPAVSGTEPVAILRQMQGDDASQTTPGAVLVNDASQTKVNLAPLEVDFSKESVVIVSLGRQPTGNYGVKIEGAQRKGTRLFVQGVSMQPQNRATAPRTPTHPFAAVVVPKFQGTVHPEIADAP